MPASHHKLGPEPQTLDEIRRWHGGMAEALRSQHTEVQRAIRDNSTVSVRFVAMTEEELDTYFDGLRRELDLLTMLNLVAGVEATIRINFVSRVNVTKKVRRKLKDPLSLAYRQWHQTLSAKKKDHPDFDENGILSTLKETGLLDNNIVGQFRECLYGRHWVGHGRYWDKPVAVDRFDTEDVYDRCLKLIQAVALP